jgi:hypothetical protein
MNARLVAEFILTTDANNEGLEAVIPQGIIGQNLPLAHASRRLNKAETRYTTSEKDFDLQCG